MFLKPEEQKNVMHCVKRNVVKRKKSPKYLMDFVKYGKEFLLEKSDGLYRKILFLIAYLKKKIEDQSSIKYNCAIEQIIC